MNQGCTATKAEKVEKNRAISVQSTVVPSASCTAPCNGKVLLIVKGGTPPFEYKWSHGATTKNIQGMCPGIYQLRIKDALGCKKFKKFEILCDAGSLQPGESRLLAGEAGAGRIEAFPVPAREEVTLRLQFAQAGEAFVQIFDVTGRQAGRIDAISIASGTVRELTVRTAGLPEGTYMVVANCNGQIATGKIHVLK
jgi:hypothetical protein